MIKKYLIVSIFVCLTILVYGQNECANCVDETTLRFVCPGKMCKSFSFAWNGTLWCPSVSSISNLDCKRTSSTSSNCYYNDYFDNINKICYYKACNATLANCGSCSKNTSCSSCYAGFFTQDANVETDDKVCIKCADNIPGCLKCSSATSCVLCDSKYRLMSDGLCHNSDGTMVNGADHSTGHIFIMLVILAVLSFIGLIMAGIAIKKRYFTRHRHQPLLQQ